MSKYDLARRSGELAGLAKRALELERELLLKRNEGRAPALKARWHPAAIASFSSSKNRRCARR